MNSSHYDVLIIGAGMSGLAAGIRLAHYDKRVCIVEKHYMPGGLNSFYLLVDKPEVYGLPPDPKLPSRNLKPSALWSALGAVALAILGVFSFRERGARDV